MLGVVIGLIEAKSRWEHRDDELKAQGRAEGIAQGRKIGFIIGRFQVAVMCKKILDIETISEVSGFSPEEIRSEKLNKNRFLNFPINTF